ncbi:MAG: OsmC family protein [Halobacteriovoraceae bacterium]|nr:OsmC family protein [Halobacteriovoraceae bacterium]
MKSQKFDFKNTSGEILSGLLETPNTPSKRVALFAHCFTCSKQQLAAARISRNLAKRGFYVLRFDFTGIGNSEGDFSNSNFSSNVDDLIKAYEAVSEKINKPELLIGHSLGGAAVLMASKKLTEIKGVVTIGAPSSMDHFLKHLSKDELEAIEKDGLTQVNLSGRIMTIKNQFIKDLRDNNLLKDLNKTNYSSLIMHSPVDHIVNIDNAEKIYSSLNHPKSFVSLDKADHLVSNYKDAEYIAEMISAWSSRFNTQEEKDFSHHHDVVTISRDKHKFTQDIYSGKHSLVADEPLDIKGEDLGMNPYQLLLSALGACTSMTLRMYADHKKIPLEGIEVQLSHRKDYVSDCESCDQGEQKLDIIHKKITLKGDLTEDQRIKIFNIAHKCPVNRTLLSEIKISEELILPNGN